MPIRRSAGVPLPDHVFRVKRPNKEYYFYQERRGRPDKGPLVRLPDDPRDPRFWEKVAELKNGAAGAAGTFKALVAHFKTTHRYTTKLAESSRETYDVALNYIDARWGALPVRDVLPKHVYALQESLSDRPSMANMVMRVLRVLLKEGIKADYCSINVAREIEPLDEAGIGAEPWPAEAFAYVIQHAPPLLMRAAILGRATGQRGVDLVRMRPVDRRENGIDMLVRKLGNERHWCPLPNWSIPIIDGWGVERMVPYLTIGDRIISEDRLRAEWKIWRDAQADKIPADITLHDLRASAVCERRIAGLAHQVICDQLCMSPGMVMRYSKHIDREMNARSGMKTLERAENSDLKIIQAAIENRKA
ncbi:MAG: hypothetical protein JNK84_17845 [Phreatobacter sp.]|uniref:hypothetical protein n=1 Tax=Phreatobacter sp. TaxID=1966341 RepID=UPI001A504917|nr:hypothetical protein [Phreatobacter sp.]MBL8570936.1 hypothetical protein [Phreatobacter sp.]